MAACNKKQRPILFSGGMVTAIENGTKNQTRRIIKEQPTYNATDIGYLWGFKNKSDDTFLIYPNAIDEIKKLCPYGEVGDTLWVREAWRADRLYDGVKPSDIPLFEPIQYLAAYENILLNGINRPSIFMPRWASRITLEITDIRPERLQDISEEDAINEGLLTYCEDNNTVWYSGTAYDEKYTDHWFLNPIEAFKDLWEVINGKGSWQDNPWLWVTDFRKA